MPGIPCLYYGSEWGARGGKEDGDDALRPAFAAPVENDLSAAIARMSAAHRASAALAGGGYRQLYLTSGQFIFERRSPAQRVLVCVNAEGAPHIAHFDAAAGMAVDMLSGDRVDFGGGLELPAYSVQYLETER
jgi:glycosidase